MPQDQGYGLFGPTPDAIRRAQINERVQQASTIGNLGPGGHGALAGGAFGRAGAALMGQAQDPRLKQAQALQDIEQQMSQMGLEPGTPEFTKILGQLMLTRLGPGPAAKATAMAQQLEIQRGEVEAVRSRVAPEQKMRGHMRILTGKRLGYSPEEAAAIAADPALAAELIKQGLKPVELTTKNRDYNLALKQGYQGTFMQFLKDTGPKGVSVKVDNFFAKPLSTESAKWVMPDGSAVNPSWTAEQAADAGARPMSAAEIASATKRAQLEAADEADASEVNGAVRQLRTIVANLSPGSFISPRDRNRFRNAQARLAKAIAQNRNPGDAEASAQAEERILEAMPDITMAIANPGALTAVLGDIEAEVGGSGGLSPRAQKYLDEANQ